MTNRIEPFLNIPFSQCQQQRAFHRLIQATCAIPTTLAFVRCAFKCKNRSNVRQSWIIFLLAECFCLASICKRHFVLVANSTMKEKQIDCNWRCKDFWLWQRQMQDHDALKWCSEKSETHFSIRNEKRNEKEEGKMNEWFIDQSRRSRESNRCGSYCCLLSFAIEFALNFDFISIWLWIFNDWNEVKACEFNAEKSIFSFSSSRASDCNFIHRLVVPKCEQFAEQKQKTKTKLNRIQSKRNNFNFDVKPKPNVIFLLHFWFR